MGVVVFTSPQVVGHQSLITSGHYTDYAMTRQSGAFPQSGYRITGVSMGVNIRNGKWETVTVKSGSATLAAFDVAGQSGARTVPLTAAFDWANFARLTLCGQDQGSQIESGSYVTVSVTWEYTTSTLTLSSGTVEAGASVTALIGAADASFTHRATLYFGTRSQATEIAAGVQSVAISVPVDWLDQIPSAPSGLAQVILETISGGVTIGASVANLTVTAPASAAPTASLSVAPLYTVGGVTYPDLGLYVCGKCGYQAVISGAAAKYGARIVGYAISGGGYAGNEATLASGLLYTGGEVPITAKVVDSRGKTFTQTVIIAVLSYAPPTASSWLGWRVNESGAGSVAGGLARCRAVYSFDPLDGKNACTARAWVQAPGGVEQALSAAMSSGVDYPVATSAGNVPIPVTSVYRLRLELTDKFGSVSFVTEIPSANFAFHLNKTGNAIAFGGASTRENAVEIINRDLYYRGRHLLAHIPVRNFLDNADFRNPVNQRGASGANRPAGYQIDRWFTVTDGVGITLNPDASLTLAAQVLLQLVPRPWPQGVVTLAVKAQDGSVACCTLDVSAVGSASSAYGGIIREASILYVVLYPGQSYAWAALYEGAYTVETLPPYQAKGYAAELVACMRYYQALQVAYTPPGIADNVTRLYSVMLPLPMAATPQILNLTGGSLVERQAWDDTGATLSAAGGGPTMVAVSASGSLAYVANCRLVGTIMLSADLTPT